MHSNYHLHMISMKGKHMVDYIVSCRSFGPGASPKDILEKLIAVLHKLHPSNFKATMLPLLEDVIDITTVLDRHFTAVPASLPTHSNVVDGRSSWP
jgi:hypothetical protein